MNNMIKGSLRGSIDMISRLAINQLACLCLVIAFSGNAFAGIADTKHNLAHWSPYAYRADATAPAFGDQHLMSKICKYCHTPHDASPAIPLWGHDLPTASFKKYSSTTLVIDNTGVVDDSEYRTLGLSGTTKLCLGCHDGLTALSAIKGGGRGQTMTVDDLGGQSSGYDNAGVIDISNKHPVSFRYNVTVRGLINDVKTSAYRLPDEPNNTISTNTRVINKWKQEDGRVECNICHDPHNNYATNDRDQLPFWVSGSVNDPVLGTYSSHDAVCRSCHVAAFGEYTQLW